MGTDVLAVAANIWIARLVAWSASASRRSAIIDADPQASSYAWKCVRTNGDVPVVRSVVLVEAAATVVLHVGCTDWRSHASVNLRPPRMLGERSLVPRDHYRG